MRLNRHYVLETTADFSREALERFRTHFLRWQAQGGALVLPPESRLVEFGDVHPALPEGVSEEGAAWAEDGLWIPG